MPLGEAHSFKDAPTVTEWRFEDVRGTSPFDKIGLHHVAIGKEAPTNPALVILYLPGTNMNGIVAPDDVKYSLALYLATHGADFWAMDYRTHFIPPATPQSDLAELKTWTYDLFASDVDEAVKFVRAHTRHGKIFLAGFSRGVTNEYLYTSMHPENVQGLVVLDGFLSLKTPRTAPADVYADDIGGAHLTYDKRKTLMEMVIANPDGPAPIPKYKTARENLEHVVYDAGGVFGGHGGLANPQGGKSDPVELAKLLITYDRYWPTVQDYENPFTPERLAALGQIDGAGDRIQQHQHRARLARDGREIGTFDRCARQGCELHQARRHRPPRRAMRYGIRNEGVRAVARVHQAASEVGGNSSVPEGAGLPISSTTMNAHSPNRNPKMAHVLVARPRRDATIAVSGASEASTASEVAIRLGMLSCGRISAKPEA